MEKTEILKDGTSVTIRELGNDDLDALMRFYRDLPLEDRKYLRVDTGDKRAVAKRLRLVDWGDNVRIAAWAGGEIVADGALELSGDRWSKHQAEIQLIIARPFQSKGLGTLMIRELYFIALQMKVELIVARMMRPQLRAQSIFRKLGFREGGFLPDHVRDLDGITQDLVVMTCNVQDLWKEMDRLFRESDWQRCR